MYVCIYMYVYMYPEALRANPPPRYLQREVGSYPASTNLEGLRRSRWVLGWMVPVGSGVFWGRPLEPVTRRASRKTGLPQSIMRSRYSETSFSTNGRVWGSLGVSLGACLKTGLPQDGPPANIYAFKVFGINCLNTWSFSRKD